MQVESPAACSAPPGLQLSSGVCAELCCWVGVSSTFCKLFRGYSLLEWQHFGPLENFEMFFFITGEVVTKPMKKGRKKEKIIPGVILNKLCGDTGLV